MRWGPHPVTLRQLQYVVAVAEEKSFHRAAARCHVSQPSLSTQIAQAEQALGVQLFERDRRRVLVTEAGADIVARARRLLVETDDLVDAAARRSDPLTGTLQLGVIPTVSPYLVPEVAPAVRRELPRLKVLWSEDKTAALMAALRAGALDGVLVAREAELGEVEEEVLGFDPFVLAAPPGHPLLKARRPVRRDELDGEELLLLADGHCLRDQALSACAHARGSAFGATSMATLVQMAAGGGGVTLLPSLAVATENRRGELGVRRFADPPPGRTLVLAWRPGAAAAPALHRVAEVVRAAAPLGRARG